MKENGSRKRVWVRATLPEDIHEGFKQKAKEEGTTMQRLLPEILERAINEPTFIEAIVKIFEPDVDCFSLTRTGPYVDIKWKSSKGDRRIFYDQKQNDLIRNSFNSDTNSEDSTVGT